MAVNGNEYDWESIEIQLPSGTVVGIEEISYKDERPVEERYGKGSKPRGYGRKNYKAEGSLQIDRPEFELLRAALGGSVYAGPLFPIVVSYANDDQVRVTDILPACKIIKVDTGAKQGDEEVGAMKLDFKILEPIEWGGVPAL